MARKSLSFGDYFQAGLKFVAVLFLGLFANAVVFAVLALLYNLTIGAVLNLSGMLNTVMIVLGELIALGVHVYVNGWLAWRFWGWK